MSSLHVHPFQSYPYSISNPEGLVRPLSDQTVALFVIVIIIIVRAGHSNKTLNKDIRELHEEAEGSYITDHPFENIADPLLHKSDPVSGHDLPKFK